MKGLSFILFLLNVHPSLCSIIPEDETVAETYSPFLTEEDFRLSELIDDADVMRRYPHGGGPILIPFPGQGENSTGRVGVNRSGSSF